MGGQQSGQKSGGLGGLGGFLSGLFGAGNSGNGGSRFIRRTGRRFVRFARRLPGRTGIAGNRYATRRISKQLSDGFAAALLKANRLLRPLRPLTQVPASRQLLRQS